MGNLLDNALRHTGPGGRISVTATASEDDEIAIPVVDTGDGVAHEHLARLFDRFYRADAARDRKHGGPGIGLSIAKTLIEAHQGRIGAHGEGPRTWLHVHSHPPVPQSSRRAIADVPIDGPCSGVSVFNWYVTPAC